MMRNSTVVERRVALRCGDQLMELSVNSHQQSVGREQGLAAQEQQQRVAVTRTCGS